MKRAGKTLRKAHLDPLTVSENEVDQALEILDNWRGWHAYALNSAQMGLRSRLNTVGADGDVSQRLKRRATIIDKLGREPTMQLTTMQDIAGCRAVVETVDDVQRVKRQWHRTRGPSIVRTDDYIEEPRPSGYRGVHIIVEYRDRLVEVQIRSELQHAWGIAVETYGARIGHDLKSGRGPERVLNFFRLVSELLEHDEFGRPVPDELVERISEYRDILNDFREVGRT